MNPFYYDWVPHGWVPGGHPTERQNIEVDHIITLINPPFTPFDALSRVFTLDFFNNILVELTLQYYRQHYDVNLQHLLTLTNYTNIDQFHLRHVYGFLSILIHINWNQWKVIHECWDNASGDPWILNHWMSQHLWFNIYNLLTFVRPEIFINLILYNTRQLLNPTSFLVIDETMNLFTGKTRYVWELDPQDGHRINLQILAFQKVSIPGKPISKGIEHKCLCCSHNGQSFMLCDFTHVQHATVTEMINNLIQQLPDVVRQALSEYILVIDKYFFLNDIIEIIHNLGHIQFLASIHPSRPANIFRHGLVAASQQLADTQWITMHTQQHGYFINATGYKNQGHLNFILSTMFDDQMTLVDNGNNHYVPWPLLVKRYHEHFNAEDTFDHKLSSIRNHHPHHSQNIAEFLYSIDVGICNARALFAIVNNLNRNESENLGRWNQSTNFLRATRNFFLSLNPPEFVAELIPGNRRVCNLCYQINHGTGRIKCGCRCCFQFLCHIHFQQHAQWFQNVINI